MQTVGPWHRWFAWRPVILPGLQWRWLVVVERRQVERPYEHGYDDPFPHEDTVLAWQYRDAGGR
jgi:hypothetical protein